jgi:hypothetical protein
VSSPTHRVTSADPEGDAQVPDAVATARLMGAPRALVTVALASAFALWAIRPSDMLRCHRASSHIGEATLGRCPAERYSEGNLMKKQLKKLTLSRETLRSLDNKHLALAAGGTSTVYGTLMECTYLNCSAKCLIDPPSDRC